MPHALPRRFQYPHDFAMFLHDCIAYDVKSLARANLLTVSVKFPDGSSPEIAPRTDENTYDWLYRVGRIDVIDELNYKAVFHAIAADFCNFILEGLRASAKGKLAVAYSLFRKAFRDNLFYLEWLTANPQDFLERFRSGGADASDVTKLTEDQKREIIEKAVQLTRAPGVRAETIYEARYDRRSNTGLGGVWDKALHLITTWKHGKTETNNLNLIFSGQREWETQWANIYWMVPYLLYHTAFVLDHLITSVVDVDESYAESIRIRRAIGYELWAEFTRWQSNFPKFNDSLTNLLEVLPLPDCQCDNPAVATSRRDLRRLVKHGVVTCRRCKSSALLIKQIFAELTP